MLLDLYHAAGIVPVDLAALDTVFASGGSYKYLSGGPGAGWLYLHPRHLDGSLNTLDSGWFAEPDPFAFERPQRLKQERAAIAFWNQRRPSCPFIRPGQDSSLL
ncbi:Class V aminotransferase (fragment) [Candidatus Methylobacter favarea]|uniref:Class V aminotransferase n=1 Tax=Candidatus Methylobacter favarea TaxID=2707345 RepID=A0A8S0X9T7_9GAMM